MRLFSFAAIFLALLAPASRATVIGFGSSPSGRIAMDEQLNTLPDGDLFLVGTFATPGNISLTLGSLSNIMSAGGWTQFGSSLPIGTVAGTFHGKVIGSTSVTNASANAFNGLPIYIIILNTTSVGTATQAGIFTAPSAATPWTFPTYDPSGISDSKTLGADDASMTAVGTVPVGSATNSPSRFVLTTLVPEPSALLFLTAGLSGLLGTLRRRQS
jgi:hypothetical protein